MSQTELEVDTSDPNPPLTLEGIRRLTEFARYGECSFRVNPATGRWQVQRLSWMDTDIPAAEEKPSA